MNLFFALQLWMQFFSQPQSEQQCGDVFVLEFDAESEQEPVKQIKTGKAGLYKIVYENKESSSNSLKGQIWLLPNSELSLFQDGRVLLVQGRVAFWHIPSGRLGSEHWMVTQSRGGFLDRDYQGTLTIASRRGTTTLQKILDKSAGSFQSIDLKEGELWVVDSHEEHPYERYLKGGEEWDEFARNAAKNCGADASSHRIAIANQLIQLTKNKNHSESNNDTRNDTLSSRRAQIFSSETNSSPMDAIFEDALRPAPFFSDEIPPKGPNAELNVQIEDHR